MTPLAPGSVIGILGGGQLGRMLAEAAARLGFDVHVYTPEPDSPAARVAAHATCAAFEDAEALARFAESVAVVTTEFENVPAATLEALAAAGALVRPNARSLALMQDRVAEKSFFEVLSAPTASFSAILERADLDGALAHIGAPAILKTRRLGYDGKGQARLKSASDVDAAWAAIAGQPAILEGFCAFEREVSIVAARTAQGAFAAYDLAENEHGDGILRRTIVPARISEAVEQQAHAIARRIAEELDYVGVFAIEFFLMQDDILLANEMAPRVHNSGHWTQDACACDQFEQHIRAIAGWPLGSTTRHADIEMLNLIGEEVSDWQKFAVDPAARLHLYGKREARPGRKMGHVNLIKLRG